MNSVKRRLDEFRKEYEQKTKKKTHHTKELSEATEQLFMEQRMAELIQENVYLTGTLNEVLNMSEELYFETQRELGTLNSRMEAMKLEGKKQNDELRMAVEKGRVSEHHMEKLLNQEIQRLTVEKENAERKTTELLNCKSTLEQTIIMNDQEIAQLNDDIVNLRRDIKSVKKFPDIHPVSIDEMANEPLLYRLHKGVEIVFDYIDNFQKQIALTDQYVPQIISPVRYIAQNIYNVIVFGLKNTTDLQPWTTIVKPFSEMIPFCQEHETLKEAIKSIDKGTHASYFRGGHRMETFIIYALNMKMIFSWFSFIFSSKDVIDKYSQTAIISNPERRSEFFQILAQLSQLQFNILTLSDRLKKEREDME